MVGLKGEAFPAVVPAGEHLADAIWSGIGLGLGVGTAIVLALVIIVGIAQKNPVIRRVSSQNMLDS
jgi:hypothetical protein